jgi:uncharacterized membrane protein (DUF485 family)
VIPKPPIKFLYIAISVFFVFVVVYQLLWNELVAHLMFARITFGILVAYQVLILAWVLSLESNRK